MSQSQVIQWLAQAQNLAVFYTLSPPMLSRFVISSPWPQLPLRAGDPWLQMKDLGIYSRTGRAVREAILDTKIGPGKGS